MADASQTKTMNPSSCVCPQTSTDSGCFSLVDTAWINSHYEQGRLRLIDDLISVAQLVHAVSAGGGHCLSSVSLTAASPAWQV